MRKALSFITAAALTIGGLGVGCQSNHEDDDDMHTTSVETKTTTDQPADRKGVAGAGSSSPDANQTVTSSDKDRANEPKSAGQNR